MPELEPPRKSDEAASETPDPIAHLHKMSTTAGVGSQDYVAINNAAIVSVILGLCTALAFLGIPFLIVGAAGIVSGIIALLQIRHSNGTQGGRGLAILGMLLSLALAGSVAAADRQTACPIWPIRRLRPIRQGLSTLHAGVSGNFQAGNLPYSASGVSAVLRKNRGNDQQRAI